MELERVSHIVPSHVEEDSDVSDTDSLCSLASPRGGRDSLESCHLNLENLDDKIRVAVAKMPPPEVTW